LSVDPHEGEAEAIALAAEPNADTQSISRKTRTDSIACGIDRMLTVKLG
jgi:predicted nucleic acid-binding protein